MSVNASARELAHFLRHIRSPDRGILGQGVRFAMVGAFVAAVYLTTTSVLHVVFAVPFQVALVIGFVTGTAVHFTLQRVFVWRHREEFALAVHHQMARYLSVAACQYGVTAASTSLLPGLLGVPVEIVYVITMLTVSVVNFLLFRSRIFHAGSSSMTPVGAPITTEFDAVEPEREPRPEREPQPDRTLARR